VACTDFETNSDSIIDGVVITTGVTVTSLAVAITSVVGGTASGVSGRKSTIKSTAYRAVNIRKKTPKNFVLLAKIIETVLVNCIIGDTIALFITIVNTSSLPTPPYNASQFDKIAV
jgi:hypothetical protein